MHGTGTSLGDPIEVGAMASVLFHHFKSIPKPRQPVSMFASKASFGHAECASGALALYHHQSCLLHTSMNMSIAHLKVVNHHVVTTIKTGE